MVSTRGRLMVLGGNPLHGSDALDSRMGACLWDLSLGHRTGDGRFDGETFLVEVSLHHASDNRERWPRSSMHWADTCAVSGLDNPST
jgi:hypothetical protein